MDEDKLNFAPGILPLDFSQDSPGSMGGIRGVWFSEIRSPWDPIMEKWISPLADLESKIPLVFSLEFKPEMFELDPDLDPGSDENKGPNNGQNFDLEAGIALLEKWRDQGLRLVRWQCQNPPGPGFKKVLWQVAKLGLWNHIYGPGILDGHWSSLILENPFMVHSHGEALGRGAYGELAPLPGMPLWRHFAHPSFILAELAHSSPRQLAAMRWDSNLKTVFSLGEKIQFFCRSPKELPPGYLDEICRMVEAGGSVPLAHVRNNLQGAHRIAYALENGIIVGNSSLKHPRPAFIQYLLEITGLDFTGFVERGYTSVRPEYRALGVGKRLLTDLTRDAQGYKVFSIIDETNVATQKIALRNNTVKLLSYRSEKSGKQMGLWMPQIMLDGMDGAWRKKLDEFNKRGEG